MMKFTPGLYTDYQMVPLSLTLKIADSQTELQYQYSAKR